MALTNIVYDSILFTPRSVGNVGVISHILYGESLMLRLTLAGGSFQEYSYTF
jgi:hypothetical protein